MSTQKLPNPVQENISMQFCETDSANKCVGLSN